MIILFYILLFFFGAAMGSFAGVILERGREELTRKSLIQTFGGRSYCPSCQHTLTVGQLVPLFGWLFQRGQCKFCRASIPQRYMWIEGVMGVVFVVVFGVLVDRDVAAWVTVVMDGNRSHVWIILLSLLVNWGLASLVIADLLWYELHFIMWLIGIFSALALFRLLGGAGFVLDGLINGIVLTAVYLGIYRFGRLWVRIKTGTSGEGMGQGDVFLAGLLGFLSVLWPGDDIFSFIQLVCWFMVVSSLLGAIYWLVRVLLSGDQNQMLPFIPAMIAARYILFVWGGFFVTILL